MLKLSCGKCVNWASGTFKFLFCICCYSYYFSNNVMLADAIDLPSYVNVSSSWKSMVSGIENSDMLNILVSQGHDKYPSFTLALKNSMPNITDNTDFFYEYKLVIYFYSNSNPDDADPTFVWSYPNYNVPSNYGATLEFTLDGDLVLRDAQNGKYLWSTNTSGLSVESMHLKEDGNLVFLNRKGESVWESYRHWGPTNTLLHVKQGLSIGQRLISSKSPFDSTEDYYVEWGNDGIHAYVNFVNPPQQYKFWDYQTYNNIVSNNLKYVHSKFSFLFLDVDGHLKWADWNGTYTYIDDFLDLMVYYPDEECLYPTACGEYVVCVETGCSCPIGSEGSLNYFKPLNRNNFSLGCSLFTPLSCSSNSIHHDFLELENVTYFDSTPSLVGEDVESCKRACLQQCSCKAVFFHHYGNSSFGNCTLPSQVLTLMDVSNKDLSYEVITFLKVQNNATTKASSEKKIVISIATSLIFLVFVTGALCFFLMKMKTPSKENDFSLDILVDMISRFSIESLKLATQNFQTKLGKGGFGSVYEGTLADGTKVAVKSLESCRQGTKEFLAEVNTIGSIHHFNLVKLIGFCDEGFNRLLVYEFMCNGSLDKWIFNSVVHQTLTWSIRRRIIEGVAAGLEYLHEHCQKNVIHFDIKPQNILLDKDFNVKISDFGLAKMVDRDESQVMTVVRGTPGYMAPELINSRAISVKADVYSLGVVILEIVCGRRNFGSSEEDILTNLVVAKANQDQLSDLIDVQVHDLQQQKEEVVNMMKIAIWCLQPHFIRPTMPKVVTVLQDLSNMEVLNNLSDLTMNIETAAGEETNSSLFRPMDSVLSGPR